MESFTIHHSTKNEYEEDIKPKISWYSVSKCTINWKVYNILKPAFSCGFSPEFTVGSQIQWEIRIMKDREDNETGVFSIYILQVSGIPNIVMVCDFQIHDKGGKNLRHYSGELVFVRRMVEKLQKFKFDEMEISQYTTDPLIFTITLEVHFPDISKIGFVSLSEDWIKFLPSDLNNVIADSYQPEWRTTTLDRKISSLAIACPKSFFLGYFLQKFASSNKKDNDIQSSAKKLESSIFSKLLKNADFDTTLSLYRVARDYSMTDFKQQCKYELHSKAKPDDIKKIVDLL